MNKKNGAAAVIIISTLILVACQANYIRDVKGGTVAPSASSDMALSDK